MGLREPCPFTQKISPSRLFLRTFFSEPGHIPDFENRDDISIGIS